MRKYGFVLATILLAACGSSNSPVGSAEAQSQSTVGRSFDICESPALDFRSDGVAATGVGVIFEGGSIPDGGVMDCSMVTAPRIGTFFQLGGLNAGLRNTQNDIAYVIWQFRIDGGARIGAFDTTGPVKMPTADPLDNDYPQQIMAASGAFRMLVDSSSSGIAQVRVLDAVGFQFNITVPE